MTNIQTILGLRHKPDVFNNREAAFRWAERCVKLHTVVLGDKEQYWVVCLADAAKLVKSGYELAQ